MFKQIFSKSIIINFKSEVKDMSEFLELPTGSITGNTQNIKGHVVFTLQLLFALPLSVEKPNACIPGYLPIIPLFFDWGFQ